MDLIFQIPLSDSIKKQVSDEIEPIIRKYPMYTYDNPQTYAVEILRLTKVDVDLMPKVVERARELLFESKKFILFAHSYEVKIKHQIDIQLTFQELHEFRLIAKILCEFFQQKAYVSRPANIHVARYRIPSKQQYSHLKNNLSYIETSIEAQAHMVQIAKKPSSKKEIVGEIELV